MPRDRVTTLDAAALKQRLATEDIVLLDVRRPDDAVSDPVRIPGALRRDPAAVDSWAGDLPPDKPVALYCVRGGSVSEGVAQYLADMGRDVLRLQGGLAAWKESAGDVSEL